MTLKNDSLAILWAIRNEIDLLTHTIHNKGLSRFSRAFVVAGVIALAAYVGVYLPPQKKSQLLQAKIDRAKSLAGEGQKIKNLGDRLRGASAALPALADREQWLSNSIRDSLSTSGLNVEDFRPVSETEANGLIVQESGVTLAMKFEEFYSWLLRVEGAKPLLHVSMIEIAKKKQILGSNQVSISLMTAIPKTEFH